MQRDAFVPADPAALLAWMLHDLRRGEALGIPAVCFFSPSEADPFRTSRYGQLLETPLGVAAGPHAQMAQNIAAAWLCGARYMELKTVQVLDELELAKPCIDMRDEGYNCEWSQELRLEQSFSEYVHGLVLLLALRKHLGHPNADDGHDPGFLLNMSAGYDLAGITSPTMVRFLDQMAHCPEAIAAAADRLASVFPAMREVRLPAFVSNNLTISTMHGCPPDEVERIAGHFIEDRRLHTTLKLNPTLLGPERLRGLLHDTLGYEMEVPEKSFEEDLTLDVAVGIIGRLLTRADAAGVTFNLKLTNTLQVLNQTSALPEQQAMVYLSGRALHPLSVQVGHLLREALEAQLGEATARRIDLSFCAGADCFNTPDLVACGLSPVTTCSDLLKPGGYGRLGQYLTELRQALAEAETLEAFITQKAGITDEYAAAKQNLSTYAAAVPQDRRYHKKASASGNVKTKRPLPFFDCAAAPCVASCDAGQDIPAYLSHLARGDATQALGVICHTNPFPNLLGAACDAQCRKGCTRQNLDAPLRIREAKAAVALAAASPTGGDALGTARVVILGANPAGLTCAHFLAVAGVSTVVMQTRAFSGGTLGDGLRLPLEADGQLPENEVRAMELAGKNAAALAAWRDVRAIVHKGVMLFPGVDEEAETIEETIARLQEEFEAVVVAGSPQGLPASPNVFCTAHTSKGPGALPRTIGEGRRAAMAVLDFLHLPASPAPAPAPALDTFQLSAARHVRNFGPLHAKDGSRVPGISLASGSQRYRVPGEVPSAIREEASRCLRCGEVCNICVTICPNRANIALPSQPRIYPIQRLVEHGADVQAITVGHGRLSQPFQIVNLADFCNECGACDTFCPSGGAPYLDKPRVHLSRTSFEHEQDGFYLASPSRLESCQDGQDGQPAQLLAHDGHYEFLDQDLRATLDKSSLAAIELTLEAPGVSPKPWTLRRAVEMALVYERIKDVPVMQAWAWEQTS